MRHGAWSLMLGPFWGCSGRSKWIGGFIGNMGNMVWPGNHAQEEKMLAFLDENHFLCLSICLSACVCSQICTCVCSLCVHIHAHTHMARYVQHVGVRGKLEVLSVLRGLLLSPPETWRLTIRLAWPVSRRDIHLVCMCSYICRFMYSWVYMRTHVHANVCGGQSSTLDAIPWEPCNLLYRQDL